MRRLLFLSIVTLILSGCATHITKPNKSYLYNIPSVARELPDIDKRQMIMKKTSLTAIEVRVHSLLEKLYRLNAALAFEVGKLPEFQDDIIEREAIALERIVNLYFNSSNQEKKAFDEMLKIGNPEYRRYCSPLQALFWMAERQDFSNNVNPLLNYTLTKLLDSAWIFGTEFTEEEILSILKTMNNKERAKKILEIYKDDLVGLNKRINSIIKYENDIFEDKQVLKGKGFDRWKNFKVVTERLNDPSLIDYYTKANFSYVNLLGKNNEYDVFFRKYGDCVGVSLFIEYCLRKAGYKAYIIRVVSPTGYATGHRVCCFKVNNKEYIMDNGRPDPKGIVEKETYLKRWGPIIGYGVNP